MNPEYNISDEASQPTRPATLRVLIIEPGLPPREAEIENTLETMRAIVGGWLVTFSVSIPNVQGVCNDEGFRLDLPLNRYNAATQSIIPGTFFLVGVNAPEHRSLTAAEIVAARGLFAAPIGFREDLT